MPISCSLRTSIAGTTCPQLHFLEFSTPPTIHSQLCLKLRALFKFRAMFYMSFLKCINAGEICFIKTNKRHIPAGFMSKMQGSA